jgi:DNA-binding IclR family transcriptional regulator
MERLSEMTRQSIHLLLRAADKAIVVESVEGIDDKYRLSIGTMLPLHVSPGARAILAALPDEEIEEYIGRNLPLEGYTTGTLTDPESLREDVGRVRRQGFAISHEDFRMGRVGIAFPIVGRDARPHGSIVVAGSRERISQEAIVALLPKVRPVIEEVEEIGRLYRSQTPSQVYDA